MLPDASVTYVPVRSGSTSTHHMEQRMRPLRAALMIVLGSVGCVRPAANLTAEHAAAIEDSARVFLAEFTRLSATR